MFLLKSNTFKNDQIKGAVLNYIYFYVPTLRQFTVESFSFFGAYEARIHFVLDVTPYSAYIRGKIMTTVYDNLVKEKETNGYLTYTLPLFCRMDENKNFIYDDNFFTKEHTKTNEGLKKLEDERFKFLFLELTVKNIPNIIQKYKDIVKQVLNKYSSFKKHFFYLSAPEQMEEVKKNALNSDILRHLFYIAKDDMIRYKIVEYTFDADLAEDLLNTTKYSAVKLKVAKFLNKDYIDQKHKTISRIVI